MTINQKILLACENISSFNKQKKRTSIKKEETGVKETESLWRMKTCWLNLNPTSPAAPRHELAHNSVV